MRGLVAALLMGPLIAGCISGSEDDLSQQGVGDALSSLVAHTSEGIVPLPAAVSDLAYSLHSTGFRRGEPTIAVADDGAIFTVGEDALVIRSTDDGATWESLDDGIAHAPTDVDPFIWLDADTQRLFNSRLTTAILPAAGWMSWSDDHGESWDVHPLVGIAAVDHQKLTTGPPPAGVSTSGYPNVLYFVYNAIREGFAGGPSITDGINAGVSLDGGRTFTTHGRVAAPGCFSGVAAPAVVTSDGAAFVASYAPACDALRVSRSLDAGATWDEVASLGAHGAASWGLDPMMAMDAADNVYAVWIGADSALYLSVSQDGGESWTEGVRVSAPGVTSLVFPDIVGGDAGRVSVAYLGTTAPNGAWDESDPSYAGDETVWHLYLATIEDALAADPLVVTARATPDEDPAQIGCIWLHGGQNDCRNLRDFMDMVEHEGNVYVAYPDGCAMCTTAEDSHELGETTVVIQRDGPRLRLA